MNTNETNGNDDMEKQLEVLERLGKEIDESLKVLDKLTDEGEETTQQESSDDELASQVAELNRLEQTIDEDISKLDSLDDEDFDDDSTERLSPENARKMLKKLTELRRVFGEIGNFVDKLGNLCEKVDNEGADELTIKPATATNE